MKKYFGTDGVRANSNSKKLNGVTLMKLGMALGKYFTVGGHRHKVVIGKDTRLSGYMIEQALTSGLLSMGMDVFLFGPIPTPAVAKLTKSMRADLGIMITASHNQYQDNGIKIFDKDGNKLSDETEIEIENLMEADLQKLLVNPADIGRAKRLEDANGRYIEFLKSTFPKSQRLDGLKIVIDCANGASYISAPLILWELGAEVIPIANEPNGTNINQECGSTNTGLLAKKVLEEKADIGIALDGDGDRIAIIDENGKLVNGDQIIALLAIEMSKNKKLKSNKVVSTSMANMGLENYLNNNDIQLIRTKVGDRYVKEKMISENLNLGGEQSGHIIMRDISSSGDGIVVALQVLSILHRVQKKASECFKLFNPHPQNLINFPIENINILNHEDTKVFIKSCEEKVSKDGRIIVRMSGTEPLLRVMIESGSQQAIDELTESVTRYFS
ncbi:phosphoglucosamine mutase [Pelagibacteraceae bacterium]|nr:phosphoglucosamine mutase [Pelagibacteraceae bacterium]